MARKKQKSGCGSFVFLLILIAIGAVATNPNLLIPILFVIIAVVFISGIASRKSSRDIEEQERKKHALRVYISDPNTPVKPDDKSLFRAADSYLNKRKKAMDRCIEAMNKATAPKPYFAKLQEYRDLCTDIYGLEKVWIGSAFSVIYKSEVDISISTNAMIDRYWFACQEKSINAAADGAKRHAYQVFFDTLALYSEYLTEQNDAHIAKYRKQFNDLFDSNSIR